MSNTELAVIGASIVWAVAITMIIAMTKMDLEVGKVYTVYALIIAILTSWLSLSFALGC